MESYHTIFERAAARHGGPKALRAKLAEDYTSGTVPGSVTTNDRWLSQFTKRVFQSGFNWKVIEAKWDGFEDAFWGFDPARCARIDMDDMERLTSNTAIVRNGAEIKSVPKNAQMILNMSEHAGSADAFIRGWPQSDYFGLLDYLNKNGARLGPNTASYALRFSGVPSLILSADVTAALKFAGVIDKPPTSKAAKRVVQDAMTIWAEQSGENLTVISRTLALSIDAGGT